MTVRFLLRRALFAAAILATSLVGGSAAWAQGVVPNPEFDVATVPEWTGNIASLSWSQTDPDCAPPNASGSLQVSPENPQTAGHGLPLRRAAAGRQLEPGLPGARRLRGGGEGDPALLP